MSDVFTKAKRSEVMSRIRSRGNKDTEIALARLLRAHRIVGWRRQILVRVAVDSSKLRVERRSTSPRPSPQRGEGVRRRNYQLSTRIYQLTVRPDFVFLKSRTVIFVDGCFWHGCPQHETKPKNNRAFWRRKFSANKKRDRLVNRALRRANWRVLRIWEHDLQKRGVRNSEHGTTAIVRRIQRALFQPRNNRTTRTRPD